MVKCSSTSEPIELCMASNQGLYVKFVSMMSPKCSIVETDGGLMLTTHTSATAAIFSGVRTVFGFFTLWFIDEDVSFFHFFHKITNNFHTHPETIPWFSKLCRNISKHCSSVYRTIFVRRKDKTIYLSNQAWAKCYHLWNKH